jgi:hypothetical protein
MDDYRWKQDGKCIFSHKGVDGGKKFYFKLEIAPKLSQRHSENVHLHTLHLKKRTRYLRG